MKKSFILYFLFLFAFAVNMQAQIEGDYWLNVSAERQEKVINHYSNIRSQIRTQEIQFQSFSLSGGFFVRDRVAIGMTMNYYAGNDGNEDEISRFSSFFFDSNDDGGSIYTDVYIRPYFLKKEGFVLAADIGLTSHFADIYPEVNSLTSHEHFYLSPFIYPVFGVKIQPDFWLLLHLENYWEVLRIRIDDFRISTPNLYFDGGGLKIEAEYYLNSKSKVVYQYFPKRGDQKRRFIETDGSYFFNSWGEGINIDLAYGAQYTNGFSVEYWFRFDTEYFRFLTAPDNTFGALLQHHKRLKNTENTYRVLGGSLEWHESDVGGYYILPQLHTGLEYWHTPRFRLAIGNAFGTSIYRLKLSSKKNKIDWLGYAEMEYFLSPKLSWQARFAMPIWTQHWSKETVGEQHSRVWSTHASRLAVRFWL